MIYSSKREDALKAVKTETELLDLWEKETDVFVRDGIFSKDDFDFASKRILFVLRDAHIVPEKAVPPYDIRAIVRNPEGEGRTWNNVARWTRALLDKASYEEVEDITPAILSTQLKRVAAINLKKEAGGPQAERIEEFAAKHKDYIKKQIEIIRPDIIFACGTFLNIKNDVFEDNKRTYHVISGTSYRGYNINVGTKATPVIEFYHPQYNKRNKELVDDMLKIRAVMWETC